MVMAKFTVDTTNKLFICKAGVITFDVQVDLYSDAKEHWLTDSVAIGFDFPIKTSGGTPQPGGRVEGRSFYLTDGWQIRPQEADHQLQVVGNLFRFPDDPVDPNRDEFTPTLGGFTVDIVRERSNLATGLEVLTIGGIR